MHLFYRCAGLFLFFLTKTQKKTIHIAFSIKIQLFAFHFYLCSITTISSHFYRYGQIYTLLSPSFICLFFFYFELYSIVNHPYLPISTFTHSTMVVRLLIQTSAASQSTYHIKKSRCFASTSFFSHFTIFSTLKNI